MLNTIATLSASFLLTSVLVSIVTGGYQLGEVEFFSDTMLCLGGSFLTGIFLLGFVLRRKYQEHAAFLLSFTCGALLALVLIYLSDYPSRSFVYPLVKQPLLIALALGLLVIVQEVLFNSDWVKKNLFRVSFFSPQLVLVFQLLIFAIFIDYCDGRLIFIDDHPSFLYRLQLLVKHFPHIPFYNTDWNGGYSAQEFYATGALNYFLLLAPLFYLSDLSSVAGSSVYTFALGFVFIVMQPWFTYFAARLIGLNKAGSSISAILALAPSIGFYEWLLSYGTISFSLSVALYPLVFALCWRVLFLERERYSWSEVIALFITASLCVLWSGAFFMLLPLALFGLFQPQILFAKARRKYVITFLVLFVAGLSLWLPAFVYYASVFNFVSNTALPGVDSASRSFPSLDLLWQQRDKAMQDSVKLHPMLVVTLLPGILFIAQRRLRVLFALTIFWLVALSFFVGTFKPQLELHRMIMPAGFLLTLLVGSIVSKFYEKLSEIKTRNILRHVAVVVVLSFVVGSAFFAPYVAYSAYTNQGKQYYKFAPPELLSLSQAIAEHGGDGRTFFSGFILHELGTSSSNVQDGGHIAPLPIFSGKQLYAFDYYHRRWSTVDPIPASYRKRSGEGIEEFLDLLYVTAVVTFKPEWRDYCQKRPEIYQEVYFSDRFRLFVRKTNTNSFILKGKGSVELVKGGLEFTPDPAAGAQEVVLRYRHLPHLKLDSNSDVALFPYFAFDDHKTASELEPYNFIGLKIESSASTKPIRISF